MDIEKLREQLAKEIQRYFEEKTGLPLSGSSSESGYIVVDRLLATETGRKILKYDTEGLHGGNMHERPETVKDVLEGA